MANGDGKVVISTLLDNGGLMKGIGNISGALGGLGKTVGKITSVMTAAFATAAVAITKQATDAYADWEQLTGGVTTLFKNSAAKIAAYAEDAFYTAGVSANQYMETVTGFSASLISSCAGDTEKAAEVANMAMIDMADNANKMGTTIETVRTAYQGFSKQQYMLLDNLKLGYGGTKTEMERLLKDAQAISGVKYNINNLADVYKAIHVIQEELGIAGATAEEAEKTITGSANMTKAAWQNVLAAIAGGGDLDKAINNLVFSITKYFENIVPVVERSLVGIGQLISKIAPQLVQTVATALIKAIPSLLSSVYQMIVGTASGIYQGIIALFSGKDSTSEISVKLNSVADSAGAAADAENALASGISNAAKAAKKSMAGFDELNTLQGNAAGGADLGGFDMSMSNQTTGSSADGIDISPVGVFGELLEGVNFEPLKASLAELKHSFGEFVDVIAGGLSWAWDNILLPLAGWIIEEAAPAAVDVLSGAFEVFGAVLEAIGPFLVAIWDNFLGPLAGWTGDLVISGLKGIADALETFAAWVRGEDYSVLTDAEKELIRNASNAADAFDRQREATQKAMGAIVAEDGKLLSIAAKLDAIVTENGEVIEGNEKLAAYLIEQLNPALGGELEIVGNIVKGYTDLRDSIKDVIKQRTAEKLLAANDEDYIDALEEKNEAWEARALAQKEYNGIIEKQNELLKESEDLYKQAKETADYAYAAELEMNAFHLASEASDLEDDIQRARDTLDKATLDYEVYAKTVIRYEEAQRLALEGNYQSAVDILTGKSNAYAEYADSVEGSINELTEAAAAEQERLRSAAEQTAYDLGLQAEMTKTCYEAGLAGFTEEGVQELEDARNQMIATLEPMGTEGEKAGAALTAGAVLGITAGVKDLEDAGSDALDGAKKAWKAAPLQGKSKGGAYASSLAAGITDKSGEVVNASGQVYTDMCAEWSTAKTDGQEVAGEYAAGVDKGLTGGFKDAFKNAINAAIDQLNSFIKWINNKLNFTIPAMSIMGTQLWPEKTVRLAKLPTIPYLAQGAVLPPNKPFMAVVGDQKHGTNVEAPLATIQEAVALVMQDFVSSNMAGHEATVAVLREILEAVLGISIGDDVIGAAMQRYRSKMSVVTGGIV